MVMCLKQSLLNSGKYLYNVSSSESLRCSHSFSMAAEVKVFDADDRLNMVLSVTGSCVSRSARPKALL